MALPNLRVRCDAAIWSAMKSPSALDKNWHPIPESSRFCAGDLKLLAVSHDAVSPRVYQFTEVYSKTLIAVDFVGVTEKLRECLAECDQAFLSPYYEKELLPKEGDLGLVQRLTSLHGHLLINRWPIGCRRPEND